MGEAHGEAHGERRGKPPDKGGGQRSRRGRGRIRGGVLWVRRMGGVAAPHVRAWPRQWLGAGPDADRRLLWQTALVLLALSVLIGVVDAQQRFGTPPTSVVAAHAHSGALGWVELGVVAAALVLFGGMLSGLELRVARVVSVLVAASVCAYVLATLVGSPLGRVIFGVAVVLGVVAFLGWLGMRSPQVRFALPHLALLLAALGLLLGTTIGALLEVQAASPFTFFPGDTADAHPLALAAGFQVLAAMAIVEWRLLSVPRRWPPLGLAQVALAAGAAVALCLGALLAAPMLLPLAFALELAAGMLFALRVAPRLVRVRWLVRGGERRFALSALYLIAYLAFLSFLLGRLTLHVYGSFSGIPTALLTANSHLLFVGVMTNALFGILFETTIARRGFWPAADELLFWGMNVGLVGFVAGLMLLHNGLTSLLLQGIFSPILGACLLVGVVAYSVRLQTARLRTGSGT